MEENQKMRDEDRIALMEAALYAAGRPLELKELAKIVETRSESVVHKFMDALRQRFDDGQSALEIRELPDSRCVLQLKSVYTERVRRLANRPLLSKGPLKTLSYVAYYQPVEQAKVVEDRGRHIYAHLRLLEETGLISREKTDGRGIVLRTTPYFADYFGFSHNPSSLKVQLKRFFEQIKIQKIEELKENGPKSEINVPDPTLPTKESVDPRAEWEKPAVRPLTLPTDTK